jgi:hypothetical protein
MTQPDCIEWMRKEGILQRQILPMHGLNDRIWGKDTKGVWKFSEEFGGRVMGDCPELVAEDCHLNKDARDAVECHSAITSVLPSGHPDKFDQSTYRRLADAYMRLLHPCSCVGECNGWWKDPAEGPATKGGEFACRACGVAECCDGPCSCTETPCVCGTLPPKRIVQDVIKCLGSSILAIQHWKASGAVVEGLGNRNGNRQLRAVWDLTHERRGGKRPTRKERLEYIEKNDWHERWMHPRARGSWAQLSGFTRVDY